MLANFLHALALEPSQLLLDPANPRLIGLRRVEVVSEGFDNWSQEQIRRMLLKQHGVHELVQSMLRTGFLPLDRLVVREHDANRYVVIEGNRRLAAVKSILGDYKRKSLTPSRSVLNSLLHLDALCLEGTSLDMADKALLIQGVRHISGVRNWGPYQQGYVVHMLITKEGLSQREAALTVGLSPSRVSSLLHGFYGLSQLMGDPDFGPKADTSYFSHFEHAYRNLSVRDWLGWDTRSRCYIKKDALHLFWRSILPAQPSLPPRVLARNVRDHLPAIVGHAEALRIFINTDAPVSVVFSLTQPERDSVCQLQSSATSLISYLKSKSSDLVSLKGSDLALIARLHKVTGELLSNAIVNR